MLSLIAIAALAVQDNTLTDDEKKAGWKLLFDGKTTGGWRGYKKDKMADGWQVVEGALTLAKKGAGDIVTVYQYENFELKIDWRIAAGGNSGIMFHVTETAGAPYETGPEMQVLDDAKHADGKSPLTSAGSCYALYPPTQKVVKPAGEWNSARLVVNKGKCENWLNGEKIVEYDLNSEEWAKKVAGSKFKAWARFGKEPKGHLDLQDHGDKVEYKNIKIKVLD